MKYSENYLFEEYGIIKVDYVIDKDGEKVPMEFYLIPDAVANTSDEEIEDEPILGHNGIYKIDFSELRVGEDDVLAVEFYEQKEGYNITITNCDKKNSFGYLHTIHGELYDDDRYYLVQGIVNHFRYVKNVTVIVYLHWSAKWTEEYIDYIENEDNL